MWRYVAPTSAGEIATAVACRHACYVFLCQRHILLPCHSTLRARQHLRERRERAMSSRAEMACLLRRRAVRASRDVMHTDMSAFFFLRPLPAAAFQMSRPHR